MLSIILKILSILGIILLVLLGLILVVLLLVLFFPICYRIKADSRPVTAENATEIFRESATKQLVRADAKAWWLFGVLRAGYKYPEPGVLKVKLLFFTLYESEADSDSDFEAETSEHTVKPATQDDFSDRSAHASEAATFATRTTQNISSQPSHEVLSEAAKDERSDSQNSNLLEKIQYTIEKFCDKIKNVFTKIKEIRENLTYYKKVLADEDTKELLKHALKRLGKILKSLRPRKLRANLLFGAASPDTTGYACAVYGMIAHHLGKHVVFTPDFEQEIFEGDIYAAGHTTVFLLLWNLLMIVKDKRLWELRDKLNREKN